MKHQNISIINSFGPKYLNMYVTPTTEYMYLNKYSWPHIQIYRWYFSMNCRYWYGKLYIFFWKPISQYLTGCNFLNIRDILMLPKRTSRFQPWRILKKHVGISRLQQRKGLRKLWLLIHFVSCKQMLHLRYPTSSRVHTTSETKHLLCLASSWVSLFSYQQMEEVLSRPN